MILISVYETEHLMNWPASDYCTNNVLVVSTTCPHCAKQGSAGFRFHIIVGFYRVTIKHSHKTVMHGPLLQSDSGSFVPEWYKKTGKHGVCHFTCSTRFLCRMRFLK